MCYAHANLVSLIYINQIEFIYLKTKPDLPCEQHLKTNCANHKMHELNLTLTVIVARKKELQILYTGI